MRVAASAALAAAALAGCAAFPLPSADQEAQLLAAHHEFQHRYIAAEPAQRHEMLQETAQAAANGDARARLRHALILSAPSSDDESLQRAVAEFDRLAASDELSPAEKQALQTWRANADTRLRLARTNDELRAELERVREALTRALNQIEQLTRIEQELEAGNDSREEH